MKKIISVILCAVILFSFCSCSNKGDVKDNELEKYIVLKTEHFEIDAAMYAFFLYDMVLQYEYEMYTYGYDTTKTLTQQTGKCAFDETKTWFEYMCSYNDSMIKELVAFATAALESGLNLTDEDHAEIDGYIQESYDQAIMMGYAGVDGLLKEYYIEGIDTDTFRKCMELQLLAYNYHEKCVTDLENGVYSDELLAQYREGHPDEFLKIDYTHYSFFATFEKDATEDELIAAYAAAKKEAEDFLSANPTLSAFKNAIVNKENEGESDPYAPEIILYDYEEEGELYNSTYAAEEDYKSFYEWAYSTDRKAGDSLVLEHEYANGEKYYTVYMIDTPVYFDDYITKNVRHILCYVDQDLMGDELTEAINSAYTKANEVMAEYLAGEKTEDAFAELANKNSDDSDGTDGGLYENVLRGYMVSEFDEWIYDPARYVGETAIIQTEYGYHIMYFVGDGVNTWRGTATQGVISELYDQHTEALVEGFNLQLNQASINMIP